MKHLFFSLIGAWLALTAGAPAAPQVAAQRGPAASSAPERFLVVLETSAAMSSRKEIALRTVHDLIVSGVYGRMRRGDAYEIWTFSDEVHGPRLPTQAWLPEIGEAQGGNIRQALGKVRFEKKANLDQAVAAIKSVGANSETLTVFLVTDGTQVIYGTPFDLEISTLYFLHERELARAKKPFVTTLLLRGEEIVAWSLDAGGGRIRVPAFPPPKPKQTAPPIPPENAPVSKADPKPAPTPPPAPESKPPPEPTPDSSKTAPPPLDIPLATVPAEPVAQRPALPVVASQPVTELAAPSSLPVAADENPSPTPVTATEPAAGTVVTVTALPGNDPAPVHEPHRSLSTLQGVPAGHAKGWTTNSAPTRDSEILAPLPEPGVTAALATASNPQMEIAAASRPPAIPERGVAESPVAAIPAESAALVLEADSETDVTAAPTPSPAVPALVVPGPDAPASGWRFMAFGLVLLLLAIGLLRLAVKRSRPPQPSLISQSFDRERK